MAVNRPGFKPNVKANLASTALKKTFVDIKPDTTVRLRFLPPSRPDGLIFTRVTNHFKLKDGDKGTALSCLAEHGTEETGFDCLLCAVSKFFKRNGNKGEQKLADDIRASTKFYAQVMVAEKQDDGTLAYGNPRLLGLNKTATDSVNQILSNQEMVDEPLFTDVEQGQDLLISRRGTGFQTTYPVDRTGAKSNLDVVAPHWAEKFITDVYEELGLRIEGTEEQARLVFETFEEDFDWEKFTKETGVKIG